MALTGERFLQGMTRQEHLARMKVNRDRFSQVLAEVEIPEGDREYFAGLPLSLRVAVITEDWCGDHVTTTPVLYRLAEDTGKLEVRTFKCDQNMDLIHSYMPEHRWDTLPIFVFFVPEDMRQISLFVETSQELVPLLDGIESAIRKAHPEVPDVDWETGSERSQELLRKERGAFRITRAKEWGRIISRNFREVVAAGLARRPDEGPAVGGTEWPPT